MKLKQIIAIGMLTLFFGANNLPTSACTSFIVSGKATKDGRPLLFKNRDTDNLNNVVVQIKGEKYTFIGVTAADDLHAKSIWMGHNEKGFGIINTAAYNLNGKEDGDTADDGVIMRRALEICATLADFETFLDTVTKPIDVDSNYGVIDAQGGCAYYETGHSHYVKFDVNDPKVAPNGYLMRTNHGMTGDRSMDMGVERYMAISDFMETAHKTANLDASYLVSHATRYLTHGLTHLNVYDFMPADESEVKMFPYQDYISRYDTSSDMLIQGVKSNEDPTHTISWTIVGNPLTTVAIPLCITSSGTLPKVVSRSGKGSSTLCQAGLTLKKMLYPLSSGKYTDYMDISKLVNRKGTGILQRILPIEKEIMDRGLSEIEKFRNTGKLDNQLIEYYQWVDEFIIDNYLDEFGLDLNP